MTKFTVDGRVTYKWWLVVEAETAQEAEQIATDRVGDGCPLTLGQMDVEGIDVQDVAAEPPESQEQP